MTKIFLTLRNNLRTLFLFSFFYGLSLNSYAQSDTIPTISKDTAAVYKPEPMQKDTLPTVITDTVRTKATISKNTDVYKFKPAVDIPVMAVGTGWSLYALTKIYKKGSSTEQEIQNLKTSDLPAYDRSA